MGEQTDAGTGRGRRGRRRAAGPERVAGVAMARVDAEQARRAAAALGVDVGAGADAAALVRALSAHFRGIAPTGGEYEQCDRCGGYCVLAVSGPLLGEVCPYCGDGPAGKDAPDEPAATIVHVDSCVEVLPLAAIRADGGTLARAAVCDETIAEYAERIAAGADLPPPVVYRDGSGCWLADGHHRLRAHERAGRTDIACEVRAGDVHDARGYAAGANAAHGLRRTRADKAAAVRMLLGDERWSTRADREVARCAAVSPTFVGEVRAELEASGEIEPAAERRGRDGKRRRLPKARRAKSPQQTAADRARIDREREEREARHPDPEPSEITVAGRLPLRERIDLDGKRRGQVERGNGAVESYRVELRGGRPVAIVIERRRAEP